MIDTDTITYMTNLAYLAGVIDGEGCITVTINPKHGRNYYRLILDITNTSFELMQWLEDTFGCVVRTNRARSSNRSNMYGWTASGKQCQELLSIVLPYLKIKKPQAELALQMNIAEHGGSSRGSYTEEEELHRQEMYELMKIFNRRNGNKGSYLRQ